MEQILVVKFGQYTFLCIHVQNINSAEGLSIPLCLTDRKALGLVTFYLLSSQRSLSFILFSFLVSGPLEKTGVANMDKQMLVSLQAAFYWSINKHAQGQNKQDSQFKLVLIK